MEESSKGKIEETQQVETEEKDDKIVINYVEETKAEVESVRETVILENSESLKESNDGIDMSSDTRNTPEEEGEAKEESSSKFRDGIDPSFDTRNTSEEEEEAKQDSSSIKDLEVLEKEKKEVINPVVDSIEPVVPLPQEEEASVEKSMDSDLNKVESKGNDKSNGVGPVLADGLLNGMKEKMSPPLTSDENDEGVYEGVSSTTEEKKSPPDDKDEFSASAENNLLKRIEEKVDKNLSLSDVETKAIDNIKVAALERTGEPSDAVIKEFVENVGYSSKPSTNTTIVGSNDAFLESTGNDHVISISHRAIRPTSWRSCCGLFEVLQRSNR